MNILPKKNTNIFPENAIYEMKVWKFATYLYTEFYCILVIEINTIDNDWD